MSGVDDKLSAWKELTARSEPSPEVLAAILAAARTPALPEPSARRWPLPERPRRVGPLALAFAAVAIFFATGSFFWSRPKPVPVAAPPEPVELLWNEPIEASFGVGEDVTYEHIDSKQFELTVRSPVRLVAVLHFQSRDLLAEELSISLNGIHLGFAPADTLAVLERSHELVLPEQLLRRNGPNTIAFEDLKNAPGSGTWRIWNVRVEGFPLPDLPRDELVRSAQEHIRRGDDFWERTALGGENAYRAWRAYRDAWLSLEGQVQDPPPELSAAADKMRQAQKQLDQLCSRRLLEAQSAVVQKKPAEARRIFALIAGEFPKRDQPCPLRADDMRAFYDL